MTRRVGNEKRAQVSQDRINGFDKIDLFSTRPIFQVVRLVSRSFLADGAEVTVDRSQGLDDLIPSFHAIPPRWP